MSLQTITEHLEKFYKTPCGLETSTALQKNIEGVLGDVSQSHILGLGHLTPYKKKLEGSAQKFEFISPSRAKKKILKSEDFDCVIMAHHLEYAEDKAQILEDVWQVLKANGRLVLIVPNKLSPWVKTWVKRKTLPFNLGEAFTKSEIQNLVGEVGFRSNYIGRALFFPPFYTPFAQKIEHTGQRFSFFWSGMYVLELKKQMYFGSSVKNTKDMSKGRKIVFKPIAEKRF